MTFDNDDPTRTYFCQSRARVPSPRHSSRKPSLRTASSTPWACVSSGEKVSDTTTANTGRGQNFMRGSSVVQVGKQGELSAATINLYRNFIKRVLVLTTSQRIAWDAKASNDDSKEFKLRSPRQ
jgi:hypothetical protein